jgi:hypothetical protein
MNNTLSLSKYWLEKVVIDLDLCPFARIPFKKGLIRLTVCEDSDEEAQLGYYLDELEELNEAGPEEISTTLIVFEKGHKSFQEFNDFVSDLEGMLEEASLQDVFQLVAFHPEFVFENTEFSARGNLVNRSPYPTLHILRSEEIARALKNPKDGEIISYNNDELLNSLSAEKIDELFYFLKK